MNGRSDEILSGEQVRTILRFSKRKVSWLLQSGYIKCAVSGKKTRKFTVLRSDLDAFVRARAEHPERFPIPEGLFTSVPENRKGTNGELPARLPDGFRDWLERKWARFPTLLPLDAAAEITGYTKKRLQRWGEKGLLRIEIVPRDVVTTKPWLIDFYCTTGYCVPQKSKKHKRMINHYIQ